MKSEKIKTEYLHILINALTTSNFLDVFSIVAHLRGARGVYVCGNGGSAANASHFVLHLRESGIQARDMFADTAYITAQSNDRSYETALRNYLRADGEASDLLVVFSGSGDSANILLALAEAHRIGMYTIGFLGMGGGGARRFCDCTFVVESYDYGVIEDVHSAVIHILKNLLTNRSGAGELERRTSGAANAGGDADPTAGASPLGVGEEAKTGDQERHRSIPGTERRSQ